MWGSYCTSWYFCGENSSGAATPMNHLAAALGRDGVFTRAVIHDQARELTSRQNAQVRRLLSGAVKLSAQPDVYSCRSQLSGCEADSG